MTTTVTPAHLVQRLRAMHVPNERDALLEKQLTRLFAVDKEGNTTPVPTRYAAGKETRGIAFVEAAGGGKTTSIRKVLADAPFLQENPETGEPRYLEIQVPNPATLKSVGLAILEATGMSGASERTTAWKIWGVVRHRLGLLGIMVLWLDEAQDLVMAQSANDTENTLRMIKSLMQGEHAVIPILSGTQRLAEMTSFDPQVSRRFTKVVPTDLEHGVDDENLLGLIEAYCEEVDLRTALPDDLCARLIRASRHRFGRAIETILNALECALFDGSPNLSMEHFVEAWAMQEGCAPSANIFDVNDWLSVPLDRDADAYEEARTKRQHKKLERV
jgi:hypothetical protein